MCETGGRAEYGPRNRRFRFSGAEMRTHCARRRRARAVPSGSMTLVKPRPRLHGGCAGSAGARRPGHHQGRAVSRRLDLDEQQRACQRTAPWPPSTSRRSSVQTPTTPSTMNHPEDDTLGGSTETFRSDEWQLEQISASAATSASRMCADDFSACAAACGL